jgi:pimeloyl-ACP methyl ester carboxylesterase
MWWRLAERTHLVAVDLPGFGHSQRSDALLSPRAMGEFIVTAGSGEVMTMIQVAMRGQQCSARRLSPGCQHRPFRKNRFSRTEHAP